jgi:hypothetical protein
MSLVTDRKYASMLAPYVRNYKHKNNAINFSCPFCGDSKKIKSKARGYLYPHGDKLRYKCHNCDIPADMYALLSNLDPNLAREYLTDRFIEKKADEPKAAPVAKPFAPPKFHDTIDGDLIKISSLPPTHYAHKYVVSRKIPSKVHYKLFFIENFKAWANKIVPNTFEEIKGDEPRLIIPLIDRNQKVMGYQGRSFRADHPVKYITLLVDPDAIKIYGLDSVDFNKKIRAFEGPIDAMFINNSVATTGGRQDTLLQQAGISKDKTILVYDNEPRNKETIEKIEKGLNSGWIVCIWPDDIHGKDVNQMVLDGKKPEEIEEVIDSHAFSGLMGLAMLSSWRKV